MFVRTETFLGFKLFLDCVVDVADENGVAREQFPVLIQLLRFFVGRVLVHRGSLVVVKLLLIL